MSNRLAASTSPYLQQHAENPVDWYEWGDEAFAAARERDVPLLVSIGYAACHWCHVMAHESFEDPAVAALMNARFVNVKVDREERPDVDAVFMAATQATTGQGGWPMTVFTTPDGEPFFCGTYFPPVPVSGRASFGQVLDAVGAVWDEQRSSVLQNAEELRSALFSADVAAVQGEDRHVPSPRELEEVTAAALDTLATAFDSSHGGFGGAPKFPPTTTLEWLLRRHGRTRDLRALALADSTLEAMSRGGMIDQLSGGFARYSVDASWTVPHFEKMLDDNAQLLRVSAHWWRATGSALALRVTQDTAGWLLRELRTRQGGFAASLDADTGVVEGATYVWTPEQLDTTLGVEDGPWARALFGVEEPGTFEHGTSVLQLRADPEDTARYDSVRRRLRAAREQRPQPARDDKVVAAWNGMAVGALAEAGAMLDRPDWVEAATGAAELLASVHLRPGPRTAGSGARLVRTSRDGVAGTVPGVLSDYACVADGFLALFSATGETRWYTLAGELLTTVLEHFADGAGGFWDTADDQTDPVLARLQRPREIADGPAPSGQSAAAGALLTYAALSGSAKHRAGAEQALRLPLEVATQFPRAAGWALAVTEAVLDGPREIAVVGPARDDATRELARVARRATRPGAVLAVGTGADEAHDAVVPLLEGRTLVGGKPTAYVCRRFVCELPVTDPADLARSLDSPAGSVR